MRERSGGRGTPEHDGAAGRRRGSRAARIALAALVGVVVVAVGAGAVLLRPEERPRPAPTAVRSASASASAAPSASTAGPIRVVAVGDSNTYGGALADRATSSYPAQLQTMLGAGYRVLNFGVNGRTLLDSGDKPYTSTDAFARSRAADPDVVLIMLGTNDAKPFNWRATAYREQLAAFVRGYQRLPSRPRVLLLTPPSAVVGNRTAIDATVITRQVVPGVEAVARSTGATLVDVHAATAPELRHFHDGVHPDAYGYRVIARTVEEAIAGGTPAS